MKKSLKILIIVFVAIVLLLTIGVFLGKVFSNAYYFSKHPVPLPEEIDAYGEMISYQKISVDDVVTNSYEIKTYSDSYDCYSISYKIVNNSDFKLVHNENSVDKDNVYVNRELCSNTLTPDTVEPQAVYQCDDLYVMIPKSLPNDEIDAFIKSIKVNASFSYGVDIIGKMVSETQRTSDIKEIELSFK